jgi:hypothetical protein
MAGAKESYKNQYMELLAAYGRNELIISVHKDKNKELDKTLKAMTVVLDNMPDDPPEQTPEQIDDGIPK